MALTTRASLNPKRAKEHTLWGEGVLRGNYRVRYWYTTIGWSVEFSFDQKCSAVFMHHGPLLQKMKKHWCKKTPLYGSKKSKCTSLRLCLKRLFELNNKHNCNRHIWILNTSISSMYEISNLQSSRSPKKEGGAGSPDGIYIERNIINICNYMVSNWLSIQFDNVVFSWA